MEILNLILIHLLNSLYHLQIFSILIKNSIRFKFATTRFHLLTFEKDFYFSKFCIEYYQKYNESFIFRIYCDYMLFICIAHLFIFYCIKYVISLKKHSKKHSNIFQNFENFENFENFF